MAADDSQEGSTASHAVNTGAYQCMCALSLMCVCWVGEREREREREDVYIYVIVDVYYNDCMCMCVTCALYPCVHLNTCIQCVSNAA